jgi:hypothetical protein
MLTSVIYLAPHKESLPYGGKNLCPWATTCPAVCLGGLGRLYMLNGSNAKAWKTLTWIWARSEFLAINGSSDVVWETVLPEIFERFPDVQFYDYTKSYLRMFAPRPENYDLTFSFNGNNFSECKRVLRAGKNVAIVFKTPPRIPGRFRGFPLLDGDVHDCRPSDKRGYWIALSPKGHAKDDTGFFVG